MQWWNDARLGMFIHFGLYAVPAGKWGNKDGYGEWIRSEAQIPVAEYGKLVFQSATGLNEEYMVSNVSACEAFAKEWDALLLGLARGA